MDIIGSGLNHDVISKREGFVRKFPTDKNKLSFQQALASVSFYQRMLPDFVPKTRVVKSDCNNNYIVLQQRIDGRNLSDFEPSELSDNTMKSLLIFVDSIRNILLEQGVQTDLVGKRDDDESSNVQKRKAWLWPFNDIYLFFRLIDIFKSSNIIIDGKGKVWFIDNVGDIASVDGSIIYRNYVDIYYWNTLYINYQYRITQLLKKRAK